MDLSTSWLGLELPHPFIAGASPLADTVDGARRLEDAGAAAIVLRSLFEEQIHAESLSAHGAQAPHEESFAEALSYTPEPDGALFGPDEYLEHLRSVKEAVAVPIIGSLNGYTPGGWLDFAAAIEEAGADGLELNLFNVVTDPELSSQDVEDTRIDVVRRVRQTVHIPVAAKIGPRYTALVSFARRLEQAGAGGIVLFNRFLEPDIDPEALEVVAELRLSESEELRSRLRWLAILSGRLDLGLAVTGGVHTGYDAIKAVMAGASVVQSVSGLLKNGPEWMDEARRAMSAWMEEHEYESLTQMRGSMDLERCPDPSVYERGNYMRLLQAWIVTPR